MSRGGDDEATPVVPPSAATLGDFTSDMGISNLSLGRGE